MLQISRFNPIGISLIIALALTLHAHAKPNILFITVDDMNADSVGCFGCPIEGTTPNLDQLAADGIRFEHAHVQVPNCTPPRAMCCKQDAILKAMASKGSAML